MASTNLVDAAFSATGPLAVSYTYRRAKRVIRDHFLSLAADFPALSVSVKAFTFPDDAGATANLFNARGILPTSPATPPIRLTIWLPPRYPHDAPLVYVSAHSSSLTTPHPFIQPSGAVTVLPYLQGWRHPGCNLTGLARSLADLFSVCPLQQLRQEVDELAARLYRDIRARKEDDAKRFGSVQAVLRERRSSIGGAAEELEREVDGLKRAVEERVVSARKISRWLRGLGGLKGGEDELEWFEGVDVRSRGLVESHAADLAIDDVMDEMVKALVEKVVSFEDYMKQVRTLAREQFFHRAMVLKLRQP